MAYQAVVNLFLPRWCPACGDLLGVNEPPICLPCLAKMPRYHELLHKGMDRLLGTCYNPVKLYSLYLFTAESAVQKVVHSIKYHGNGSLGIHLGRTLGRQILEQQVLKIDYIVPIPLTREREMERGYNQSALLARGISSVTGIPYVPDALKRVAFSGSQTGHGRQERVERVAGHFAIGHSRIPAGSHVLIVDDVLTTGATISYAINAMKDLHLAYVSVATIAVVARQ